MDESSRFIPLAFTGAVLSAIAFVLAIFAGDALASIFFLCASVVASWYVASRADASANAYAQSPVAADEASLESETRDGIAARVFDPK